MVLLKALALGFMLAASPGPVGLLLVRRTLAEGRLMAFAGGVGVATADALYAALAGFGVSFVSGLLVSGQTWLRLAGGAFLCYLGLRSLLAKPPAAAAAGPSRSGLAGSFASMLLLTLTNPMTILSFVAIFGGIGLAGAPGGGSMAGLMVAGIFAGSLLWWMILCCAAGMLRSGFQPAQLVWVNRVSGMIIILFGLSALRSAAPWRG